MKSTSFIIGIAGGSGSGKTTFAQVLAEHFEAASCLLSQDNYYIDQSDRFDGDGGSVNFDHPDSIDFQLLSAHLKALKNQQSIQMPIYDFPTHTRSTEVVTVQPSPVIIVEGTLILSQPNVRSLLDASVFIEVDEAIRFERRLKRDTETRGREPSGVMKQLLKQVKPMHDQFVEPSKRFASYLVGNDDRLEKCRVDLFRKGENHVRN